MNIIRTKAVNLTTIPAIAYKVKLQAGGAGVKVLRTDCQETASITLDRRSDGWVPYGKIDPDLFPIAALDEAVALTSGLGFTARGNIKITPQLSQTEEDAETEDEWPVEAEELEEEIMEEETNKKDITQTPEYLAVVNIYKDGKGKLNYALLNKDFIQFASRSSAVAEMTGTGAPTKDVVNFIVKNRVAHLANKKDELSNEDVDLLIDALDGLETRSAFKELRAFLTRLASPKSRR